MATRYKARGTIRLKIESTVANGAKSTVAKACFCPVASSTVEDENKEKHAVFLASDNKTAVARGLAEGLVEMGLSAQGADANLFVATLSAAATAKSCVEVEVEEEVGHLKLVSLRL